MNVKLSNGQKGVLFCIAASNHWETEAFSPYFLQVVLLDGPTSVRELVKS